MGHIIASTCAPLISDSLMAYEGLDERGQRKRLGPEIVDDRWEKPIDRKSVV